MQSNPTPCAWHHFLIFCNLQRDEKIALNVQIREFTRHRYVNVRVSDHHEETSQERRPGGTNHCSDSETVLV